MPRGLFVNVSFDLCSIYESGISIYQCLKDSKKFKLDYAEINTKNRKIPRDYDFYLFNYHWVRMGWLNTQALKKLKKLKFCVVLETYPKMPLMTVEYRDFDAFIVLDPSERSVYSNVHFLPRPLNTFASKSVAKTTSSNAIKIGSYGIGLKGKGYLKLVAAVNKEFDFAEVNLNLPILSSLSKIERNKFIADLDAVNSKNMKINITTEHLTRLEIVEWCAENTINVFLYDRNLGPGLSASTDQAIESGRPLLVSTNPTFRHLHNYITPYPFQSIRSAIENTQKKVFQLQEEWSDKVFRQSFEDILSTHKLSEVSN
jgi:hypothetical protein